MSFSRLCRMPRSMRASGDLGRSQHHTLRLRRIHHRDLTKASSETDLFANVNGFFGCFVLSPADASISSDLGFYQPDGSVVSVGYTAASPSEPDSSDHTFRLSGSTRCTPG